MTDVFVELERLTRNLETLRDELVKHPDERHHVEVRDARRNCRKIDEELRSIASLLWLQKEPADPLEGPPPRSRPTLVKP
jgi:hypothetical protein